MKDFEKRSSIDNRFLNLQCERYNVRKDIIKLDWQLIIAAGSENLDT